MKWNTINYSCRKNDKKLPWFVQKLRVILVCLFFLASYSNTLSQEYFQQEVNYKIQVSLNDKLHKLSALETLEYINHSPDTLHLLYFHLWPNAYSNNTTPLARQMFQFYGKEKLFNNPELRGAIDSLDFAVNGSKVNWELLSGQPDICRIYLEVPLNPGDSLLITTPFRVKIPKGVTSRLGHIGESYQISQWYPKPAVYDKNGWHPMSYLDQGEFYSEFGRFEVYITLPANYIVGTSGNLQNYSEIEMLDKLAADTAWIKTASLTDTDFPASSKQVKTLHYTADKIHDFAWFADKRFHVQRGKVKLPNSDREVTTMVLFTNEQSELWKDALQYVDEAIYWFSDKIGDYPYQSFTAVQSALTSGDGMEYPGLTVVGLADNAYALDEVLSHEICHNWFYSALGSNERRYPFMDESITSAYTDRYLAEKYPEKKLWEVYLKNRKLAKFVHVDKLPIQRLKEMEWLFQARNNREQPINIPATEYTDLNYVLMLYNKAAISFNYLRIYLGDAVFDSAMQEYFRQWRFKHPQPEDLREIIETHSEKDLSWFFTDLLGTTKRIDYKMVRTSNQQVLIKNKGELVSPLFISGTTGDSIFFEKWEDGFKGKKWIDLPSGDYTELIIDPGHTTPEIFRINNNIKTSGTFPKADPIRTQLLFSMDDTEAHTIMYMPAINWTRENSFMLGMAIHNGFIIPKPIEYFVMPFYAFGNSDLAGFGRINYNITPYDKLIRLATISLEGTQFGAPGNYNYHRIKTGLELHFRNKKMTHPFQQSILGNYIAASNLSHINHQEKAKLNSYIQIGYLLEKTGFVNPYTLLTSFESGKTYKKTSLELNYKLSYLGKKDGLEMRFFAGAMLKNDANNPFYAFSASGRNGREQYLYEGNYPDRFSVFPENFFSRQMTLTEGGLVSPLNNSLGYSRWLISFSLTSNLPGKAAKFPVKPFLNLLMNDHGISASQNSLIFYEAGLKTGFWNFFEIYIPLLVSKNIDSVDSTFKNRIRFVFSIDSISRFRLNGNI
ncbi:M1 family metallopeptidase [uncultured Draconibacterium sp.]|uniref:M1 family metallopeptidase n=1 Tax=uncultured Draconibacterium sp. TaxID=1573823 RepID=UPI0029C63A8B|nr:M1 family metallopeptidase [uncultured Draconibacterium sp.]